MLSWCSLRQGEYDWRRCWNCFARAEARIRTLECKVLHMSRYRLFSLYRGNGVPEAFGYYNRLLVGYRQLGIVVRRPRKIVAFRLPRTLETYDEETDSEGIYPDQQGFEDSGDSDLQVSEAGRSDAVSRAEEEES